jgi:hypothetical protein
MISIIISSANKVLLDRVRKNIADTISVTHEIIAYDNSDGLKGICEIYNQGINQAQYDILCFMHEDIAFNTVNWGNIVIDAFNQNPDLGLLGVAGSTYKALAPSGWHALGVSTEYLNIVQQFKFEDREPKHYYRNPRNEELTPVVCLDGVWLSTRRSIALANQFDESFTGFHVYDLDFSLKIFQQYKNAVTYSILIDHFSEGNYNADWATDTIKLHEKWNYLLPINLENLDKKNVLRLERMTFKHFIDQLLKFNLPLGRINRYLWRKNKFIKISFVLFIKLQYHLVAKWLKQMFAAG